jgi:hypothetical protein
VFLCRLAFLEVRLQLHDFPRVILLDALKLLHDFPLMIRMDALELLPQLLTSCRSAVTWLRGRGGSSSLWIFLTMAVAVA